MAVGHDMEFFSLDIANLAWTRCFFGPAGTVLVLCQCSDADEAGHEPALRAIVLVDAGRGVTRRVGMPLADSRLGCTMTTGIPTPVPSGGLLMAPLLLASMLALAPPPAADAGRELLPPVRRAPAGKPIDTEVGHAAPFVADFDGDGVKDLLVGQFGDGLLWFYRNVGTNAAPEASGRREVQGRQRDGRVPTG